MSCEICGCPNPSPAVAAKSQFELDREYAMMLAKEDKEKVGGFQVIGMRHHSYRSKNEDFTLAQRLAGVTESDDEEDDKKYTVC